MRTRVTRQPEARRTPRRAAHPVPRAAARGRTGEDRVREAGGPQDLAFYRCDCGYSFADDVSTHVACPKCGTGQVW